MSEILLVGGRPEEVRTVAAALEPLRFLLAVAPTGAEAVRLLRERDFALIILLTGAGWREGLDAARLLKARGGNHELPIVFLATDLADGADPRAHDEAEAEAAVRGQWLGTVDYLPAPTDPELLRARMAIFAERDEGRLALQRSEALLRAAFEAAPIGKTVLDEARRIVRANRAFLLLLGGTSDELLGTDIAGLAHPNDRGRLVAALSRVAGGELGPDDPDRSGFNVHLRSTSGSHVWTCAYLSVIDPTEVGEPLLMIQWVDLSSRRHAEQARAELAIEHVARERAEATAERLNKLQTFSDGLEALSLEELLPELALRLADQFEARLAEVRIDAREERGPAVVRAAAGRVLHGEAGDGDLPRGAWQERALVIEGERAGSLRVVPPAEVSFSAEDRSLLGELAARAALSIRSAQLHEEEHRIAATLQRGLLPPSLPEVPGLELTAHYEPAGDFSEVGGDWYDVFELEGERLGIVLGDVAGKGIPAATTMGEIRSVTRAFAFGDGQTRKPSEVLTRLNRHHLAQGAEEMFSVLYAIVDPRRRSMVWANAGHPPPLLHRGSGESSFLAGGDGLMGIDDIVYADLHEQIGEHDTLIAYTDGVVERRGEALDAGLDRLERAVAHGPEDPEALCRHIVREVVPSVRTPSDDVTIVIVRVC